MSDVQGQRALQGNAAAMVKRRNGILFKQMFPDWEAASRDPAVADLLQLQPELEGFAASLLEFVGAAGISSPHAGKVCLSRVHSASATSLIWLFWE